MKALSVRQPWAHAIFHLGKEIENRDWKRRIVGETISIHAAATLTNSEYEAAFYFIQQTFGSEFANRLPGIGELTRGAIIGTAKVMGIVSITDVNRGFAVSGWFVGRYGYQLDERMPLNTPIPCKGALGLWDVPEEIADEINAQRKR